MSRVQKHPPPQLHISLTIGYSECMPAITREYASLNLAVDIVILTIRHGDLHVLLVKRGKPPFHGQLALPGGFVRDGESLDAAALRELKEETGLDGRRLHLEQLHAYGDPRRDPRSRIVSVAYLTIAPDLPMPVAGTDATEAHWTVVETVLAPRRARLAFDHSKILNDALERARERLEYTTVATRFCVEPFTIADLRHVYEAVWGASLDPGNFSRKVTRTEGFVVPTGALRPAETGRPAALFRRGTAANLYPPMLRTAVAGRDKG